MSEYPKMQEIEPYPATFGDNGLVRGWKHDPDSGPHMLAADVQTRVFEKYGTFQYFGVKKDPKDYTEEDKAKRKEIFEDPESAAVAKKLGTMPTAEGMWVGAMQKNMVQTVHLVVDDPEAGIFIFYAFMNNPKYMQFLGRLDEGTELHIQASAAFYKFAREAVAE
jgi:hypothetical protein